MNTRELIRCTPARALPGVVFRRLISKCASGGPDALTPKERVLWFAFELCGEVSNGGVDQFFSNSSGNTVRRLPKALRALALPRVAAVVERAIALFPTSVPLEDRLARNEALRAFTPEQTQALQAIDDELTQAIDPVLRALTRWIKASPASFPLSNAGLAGFRPVTLPDDLRLDEVLARDVEPELALPALYVKLAGAPARSLRPAERQLFVALRLIGEVREDGLAPYLASALRTEFDEAVAALDAAGATSTAALLRDARSQAPARGPLKPSALSDDARSALASMQWQVDERSSEVLPALVAFAARHRDAFAPRWVWRRARGSPRR